MSGFHRVCIPHVSPNNAESCSKRERLLWSIICYTLLGILWLRVWPCEIRPCREALQHIGRRRYTVLLFLFQQHCGITLYFSLQDEGLYTVTASNLCGSISYSVIVRILEDEQEYEWMAYRRSKQIIPRYFTAIVNTETSKIFKFIVQIIEAKTCVLYCNMLSRYIKGRSKSKVVCVGSGSSRK